MVRHILLLALLVVVSYSAPISDPEASAKRFWGAIATKIQYGTEEEVAEILFDKADSLFPGLLTKEEASTIKTAVIQHSKKEKAGEESVFELPEEITEALGSKLRKRLELLSDDAKVAFLSFAEQLGELDFDKIDTMKGRFGDEISNLKTKFETLPSSTRDELAKAFPVFNHLGEIKALVVVAERIFLSVEKMCQELPGFPDCEIFD
ncbi:hypothetical protein PENTCL1PPCAC_1314 [Pristionchus entomophagus]|uniref:Fatty-acid and retinol-binding protein 1 n=1 Tax=Pristionchus entomophagus TaxID=358040 RepID=A0AAV5SCQ8_9BILA|nr:hypothetical protein PENTCL1PPCAC_1314 [Pristionchus entomophagus]